MDENTRDTCSNHSRPSMPQEASDGDTPIPVTVTSNPRARQRSTSNASQTNTTIHRGTGGTTTTTNTNTNTNNNQIHQQNTSPASSTDQNSQITIRNHDQGNASNHGVNSNPDNNNNSQQRNKKPPPPRQQQESNRQPEQSRPQKQQQQGLSELDNTVRPLLRGLRMARTVDAALTAMESLYRALLDNGKDTNVKMARSITQWNGCGAILMALKDWYMESTFFSMTAIRVLILITGSVPIAKQFIVELGGLRTLVLVSEAGLRVQQQTIGNKGRKPPLTVQQRKQLEYNLQSNVVGLLHNLMGGVDNSIGREVAAEECLDLVVTALKQRPLDKYTQKRGIRYLLKAGKMQDAQVITMLQKKQVGILFVQALDQFRHSNPSIRNLAQEALIWYASN